VIIVNAWEEYPLSPVKIILKYYLSRSKPACLIAKSLARFITISHRQSAYYSGIQEKHPAALARRSYKVCRQALFFVKSSWNY
jgi:hypothetical protein